MSTECLSAYFRRRILLPRVFILWALLVFAAEAGSDRTLQAFLLLSLIVQFRVLDDYADRGHDAAVHPERIMVDQSSAFDLRRLALALTAPIAALAWLQGDATALLGYLLLLGAMTWLADRLRPLIPRFWRTQAVLLKYPAFVGLVSPGQDIDDWGPNAVAVLLILCLYEFATDRELRSHPASQAVMMLAALFLAATLPATLGL